MAIATQTNANYSLSVSKDNDGCVQEITLRREGEEKGKSITNSKGSTPRNDSGPRLSFDVSSELYKKMRSYAFKHGIKHNELVALATSRYLERADPADASHSNAPDGKRMNPVLDPRLKEALRKRAFDEETSMTEIARTALYRFLNGDYS